MYTMLLIFLISSCSKTISFLDRSKEKKLILKTEDKKRILVPNFIENFQPKENFMTSIKEGSLKSIYLQTYPLHLSIYSYIYDKSNENFQKIEKVLKSFENFKNLLSEEDFEEYINERINGYDTNGLTPLHVAVLSKEYKVIELIFSEKYGFKFDVNIATAYEKVTPLSLAISLTIGIKEDTKNLHQDMNNIINKIISFKPKLGLLDKDNISECGYAALSGDIELIKNIIENLNYQISEEEISPLALSAANNNYNILSYLSDKENYQKWGNLKKLEFVSYVFKNSNLQELRKSLNEKPILEIIEKYMEEYKNTIDTEGKTPLIYSIEFNNQENINKDYLKENLSYSPKLIFDICKNDDNYEFVKNLLNQKINFDLRDSRNNTPLHISLKSDAVKIASILINTVGAQGINKANSKGQTPLHIAAANNHITLVERLLKNRADVNITDKNGNTPLHYAVLKENVEVIRLLIGNEAKLDIHNNQDEVPADLSDKPYILQELKRELPKEIDVEGLSKEIAFKVMKALKSSGIQSITSKLTEANIEETKENSQEDEILKRARKLLKDISGDLGKINLIDLDKEFEIIAPVLTSLNHTEDRVIIKDASRAINKYIRKIEGSSKENLKRNNIDPEKVSSVLGSISKQLEQLKEQPVIQQNVQ